MKIHQLPHGARFLFEGVEYVKTGPMIGTGPQGQKMFPRYLELQAADATMDAAPTAGARLEHDAVLRAFERFCGECRGLIDLDRAEAFAAARERFLAALR